MSNIFPDALPALKRVMIVIDFRGSQYAGMSAAEYAVRVAGQEEVMAHDLVLVARPDNTGGAIVRGPEGFGGATFTMQINEAAGHAPPIEDEDGDEFVNLRELLEAMKSEEDDPSMATILDTAATWVAARYNHDLPEIDPS